MTKNKNPALFWKKWIDKKKKTSISSLKSEPNILLYDNKVSVENKRASGLFFYKIPTPVKEEAEETTPPHQDLDREHKEKDILFKEQPNITPTPYNNKQENKSDSSFVVLETNEEEITELKLAMNELKEELEQEKATNLALQKQKQAVAKDLDYFEVTLDELSTDKNKLTEELKQERIKSQQHLDDLNLLLQKMKSNTDTRIELSLVKSELKHLQEKSSKEYENYLIKLSEKDITIQDLNFKLDQSQQQTDTLKDTIKDLINTHNEELTRIKKEYEIKLEQEKKLNIEPKLFSKRPSHVPRSSESVLKKSSMTSAVSSPEPATVVKKTSKSSPVISPEPSTVVKNNSTSTGPATVIIKKSSNIPLPQSHKKPSNEQSNINLFRAESTNNLDDQLLKLIKEKEKLQSSYSRLPLNGGGLKYHRRKDELESMLDQIDSQLSKVKQKIKNSS